MTLFEQHQLPCILESRLSKRYQPLIMEHMTVYFDTSFIKCFDFLSFLIVFHSRL
ncbi:hypothetical protein [Photobacterium profundum]|uniref:hypothetical protein n=1 Tax=Photobacterium profundum TaxID=74109 RepID=UPI0012F47AD9|nr:hypothetical protein [Photobacterium profundum]